MKKTVVFLLGVIGLIGALSFYTYFHFKPQYNGEFKLEGLSAPVNVHYDNFGIPHIEAKNKKDLYRAYGYVVAQDRFFQMQFHKKVASGRLSEWFGSKTIETDKLLRNVGFHRWSKAWLGRNQSKLNPELLENVESWLAGVNHCFAKCPRPLEMILLRAEAEPLDLADVLAFSGVMSFSFTKAYNLDAVITDIMGDLSPNMLFELTGKKQVSKGRLQAEIELPLQNKLDPMGILPNFDGSQSWVIAPTKSASGHAVLVNDPHIAHSNPGVWYEAHLKSPNFELYGHFVPVIPFSLIGHNLNKAWALTMSNADELDLILQKDVESFTTVNEEIKVKGAEAIQFPVKLTEWGPVISQIVKTNRNFIMHWGFFNEDNFIIESFYDLNNANKIENFHSALAKGSAPGLNISWADKEGNIAWKMFGDFPHRKHNSWSAAELKAGESPYEGIWPKEDNPSMLNPKQGFILSANQKPPVQIDETKIQGYWDSSERYDSLYKKISEKEKISTDYNNSLFLLNNLEGARDRLQSLIREVEINDEIVLKQLQNWGGDAGPDNLALGFYFEWIDAISREVLLQKMNEKQLEQFCDTNAYWIFSMKLIDNKSSDWWNSKRGEILQKSFDYTLRFMRNTYGDPAKWRWSEMHLWTIESPLGKVKPLNKLFNLGPYKIGGSFMVPNAQRHRFCRGKFDVSSGPSTRRIVDFKNPEKSWGILPSGNSGVIFSPFYKDQTSLFLAGKLRPQEMNWIEIRKNTLKLILR